MSNTDQLIEEASRIESQATGSRISIKSRSYIDPDTGSPTFYVKNFGNTRLYFSKLALKINPGEAKDLTEEMDVDSLNKDPELRKFLANGKKLRRLTREEFDHERAIDEDTNNRIAIMRQDQEERAKNPTANQQAQTKPISVLVKSKVMLLKKFYDKDPNIAKTGLTPIEFIKWARNAEFQSNDIDHVLSEIDDPDVKSFMFKRKKELFN